MQIKCCFKKTTTKYTFVYGVVIDDFILEKCGNLLKLNRFYSLVFERVIKIFLKTFGLKCFIIL
jgi:hypothetical protein